MHIALGVHVSTYEVTASLVDTTFPDLGPIATRTVAVAAAPGGIGGAVSTALGFMRVRAMQNGLDVQGAAVVCENALQCEIVADALAVTEADATPVVDIFDERLSDAYSPDVSAALLIGVLEPSRLSSPPDLEPHRGVWPIAAVGACVLAALGGVTAWAMTAETPAGGGSTPSRMVYPSSAGTSEVARPIGAVFPSPTEAIPAAPTPDVVPMNPVVAVLIPPPASPTWQPDTPDSPSPPAQQGGATPGGATPTEPGPSKPDGTNPGSGGTKPTEPTSPETTSPGSTSPGATPPGTTDPGTTSPEPPVTTKPTEPPVSREPAEPSEGSGES